MGTAVIFEQVLALLLMMGVGLVARKRGLIDDRLAKGLTGILLGISLPALILLSFNIEPDPARMRSVVAVVLASVIFHAIMLPGAALGFRRWGRDRRNVLVFLAHFPNVGFMGMPLVFAIFGAEGVFYASLFMIPFNIVMWTYGQGLFLNAEESVSWRTRLTNPIILSIAAGIVLFLTPWSLPGVVFKPLQMLGAMTTPLAMIVIGDMIGRSSPRGMFTDRDVLLGMSVRLIAAPLIMAGILKLFHADPVAIKTCIVLEALPAAISLAVLPARYGGDTTLASRCVVVSHILSMVTLPAMVILLSGHLD